jgi:hypothetical protein
MTIHGLWPNYNDGTWPEFCDPQYKFDDDAVADLIPDLKESWPSDLDSNEIFWGHEWEKHGTCALSVLSSEKRYFKTTLKLHWKYDLAAALRAADITPSNSIMYPRKDIEGAIAGMFRVDPIVRCDVQGQLSEIWMCVSKDLELMECPAQAMVAFSGQGEDDQGHAVSSNHCEEILIPLMPRSSGADSSEGDGSMAGLLRESHITRPYFKQKSIASKKAGQVVYQEAMQEANANAEEAAEEDENDDEMDEEEEEEEEEEDGEDHKEHTRKHRHHHNQWSGSSEDDDEDFYLPPGPPISVFLPLLFICLGALLGVGLVTLKSSWARSRLLSFDYHAVPVSRPSEGMLFQMSTTADSPMSSKV